MATLELKKLPNGVGAIIDKNDVRTLMLYVIDGKVWALFVNSFLFPKSSINDIYKAKVVNNYVGSTTFLDAGLSQNVMISGRYQEGDYLLVQVLAEEHEHKNARVTDKITLNTNLVVYCPNDNFEIDYSKKLSSHKKAEFKKIEDQIKDIVKSGAIIIRTTANNFSSEDVLRDIRNLVDKWDRIKENFSTKQGVGLIQEGDTKEDIFYKDFLPSAEYLITNDDACITLAKKLKIKDVIKKDGTIIDFPKLLEETSIYKNSVILPDGQTNLHFDYTEACTFIDVNQGGAHLGKNRENALLDINLKASKEIARQISLRNIGGAILVDFISMRDEENNKKLISIFKKECEKDKQNVKVYPEMTRLGMVEIVRKRAFKREDYDMIERCHVCNCGMIYSQNLTILIMVDEIQSKLSTMQIDSSNTASLGQVAAPNDSSSMQVNVPKKPSTLQATAPNKLKIVLNPSLFNAIAPHQAVIKNLFKAITIEFESHTVDSYLFYWQYV